MTKSEQLNENASLPIVVCPHLGLEEDEHTCTAYPSGWNVCYHAKPVATIKLDHQQKVCLTLEHRYCPMFKSEKKKALPTRLRGGRRGISSKSSRLIFSIVKRD